MKINFKQKIIIILIYSLFKWCFIFKNESKFTRNKEVSVRIISEYNRIDLIAVLISRALFIGVLNPLSNAYKLLQ
jgi:hypothetical protein